MVPMRISLSSSDGLTLGPVKAELKMVTSNTDDQASVVAFEAFETRVRRSNKAAET